MIIDTFKLPQITPMERRLRRNRKSPSIRKLLEETRLLPSDFVAPFFLIPGIDRQLPAPSMPGVYKLSLDKILKEAEVLHKKGITSIALFPVIDPELKDFEGSEALNPNGLIPQAIRTLKKEIPSLTIISDVALDPYTTHGHDGLINQSQEILNDESLIVLAKQALIQAEAGVDIVAPSDMMDGRIKFIRQSLDLNGFKDVSILSYTAKFASSLYKGFRDTVGSKLSFGDKLTYQLSPCNTFEALLEAKEDVLEGADMLLVKPGIFYLDILSKIKTLSEIPVGAFQVSGEYSMIMAADKLGFIDGLNTLREALTSLKRAGASFIFTYALKQLLVDNQVI